MLDLPDGIDIRCCDCLGPEGLLSLADGSVALTVTSPPYNQLERPTLRKPGKKFANDKWMQKITMMGYSDNMPEDEYLKWQIAIATEVFRATKPGGSFFYNHKVRYRKGTLLHPLDIVRQFSGWRLKQELVWDRGSGIAFNTRLFVPSDERIYWLVKDGDKHPWNNDASAWFTVWRIFPEHGIDGHPCPYPVSLVKRCILACTNPGDLVCDPFLGSGTTAEACYQLGRRFVGFEKEQRYVDIAVKRLQQQRFVL